VQQPPDNNRRGDDQQSEDLIAPEEALLTDAAGLVRGLFRMRLGAVFSHRSIVLPVFQLAGSFASIGGNVTGGVSGFDFPGPIADHNA
jgi:hypothetical protein